MNDNDSRPDPIAFGERLLSLLDQGRFTATYKYAVLLALIDVCLEGTDHAGRAPTRIPTADLARKILELYWPHTVPYVPVRGGEGRVLRQNISGQAEIVSDIRRFRERHVDDRRATLSQARGAAPDQFDSLLRTVEWKLAEMPLPRLQLVGNTRAEFLYRIGWDESIRRAQFFSDGFDRGLQLEPGTGELLVSLAGLLRPLIQRQWTAWIARQANNRELIEDAYLDEFLFGTERIPLERVRPGLRELQRGLCFYCQRPTTGRSEVDHFIPWSRYADNGIHNLALACRTCNNSKRDYLAAGNQVARWSERLAPGSDSEQVLAQIASENSWESHPDRTLGVARNVYLHLPGEALLWSPGGHAIELSAERSLIERALAG